MISMKCPVKNVYSAYDFFIKIDKNYVNLISVLVIIF